MKINSRKKKISAIPTPVRPCGVEYVGCAGRKRDPLKLIQFVRGAYFELAGGSPHRCDHGANPMANVRV